MVKIHHPTPIQDNNAEKRVHPDQIIQTKSVIAAQPFEISQIEVCFYGFTTLLDPRSC
jgi:hypothetical protein